MSIYVINDRVRVYTLWLELLEIYSNSRRNESYQVCRRVNILRDYPDDKTKYLLDHGYKPADIDRMNRMKHNSNLPKQIKNYLGKMMFKLLLSIFGLNGAVEIGCEIGEEQIVAKQNKE